VHTDQTGVEHLFKVVPLLAHRPVRSSLVHGKCPPCLGEGAVVRPGARHPHSPQPSVCFSNRLLH
jgi:hypothetical protein